LGKLYVCATPIGNLEDVSIRLLKVLRKVDVIVCEDTRQTVKLLNRYRIKKHLLTYHKFSGKVEEDKLIEQLKAGKVIALVSDAGIPAISDPGQNLIRKAIEASIDIEIIPGPSALISALVISGLDSSAFVFEGFLPNRKGKRQETLKKLQEEMRTVIIYEAPHRLLALLEDIEEIMGKDRQLVLARELTKKHEEVKRGRVSDLREHFEKHLPRGEITVLIKGKETIKNQVDLQTVTREVEALVEKGMKKNEAFKMKAKEYNIKKSDIYNYYVNKCQ